MNTSVKDMLNKISLISDSVTSENQEMEEIDKTIGELNSFAEDIAGMMATLYK